MPGGAMLSVTFSMLNVVKNVTDIDDTMSKLTVLGNHGQLDSIFKYKSVN
jgi:hypothetical protein